MFPVERHGGCGCGCGGSWTQGRIGDARRRGCLVDEGELSDQVWMAWCGVVLVVVVVVVVRCLGVGFVSSSVDVLE